MMQGSSISKKVIVRRRAFKKEGDRNKTNISLLKRNNKRREMLEKNKRPHNHSCTRLKIRGGEAQNFAFGGPCF
jgi:hypothetical protein